MLHRLVAQGVLVSQAWMIGAHWLKRYAARFLGTGQVRVPDAMLSLRKRTHAFFSLPDTAVASPPPRSNSEDGDSISHIRPVEECG